MLGEASSTVVSPGGSLPVHCAAPESLAVMLQLVSSWLQGSCSSSGHHRPTRLCSEPGREGASPHPSPFTGEGLSTSVRGSLAFESGQRVAGSEPLPRSRLVRESGRPVLFSGFVACGGLCSRGQVRGWWSASSVRHTRQGWCPSPVVAGCPLCAGRVCLCPHRKASPWLPGCLLGFLSL